MKILAVFAFFLLMSKCKRDEKLVNDPCSGDCVTFNVRVGTDQKANSPMSGLSLELGWENKKYLFIDPGRLIATGKTDANGKCEFSFKALDKELKDGNFYIKMLHSDEYHDHGIISYQIKKSDSVVNTNIYLASKANLKVVLKNFNPLVSTDSFRATANYRMYYYSFISSYGILPYEGYTAATGPFVTKELSAVTAGNDYTHLMIYKKVNGIETQVKDSIYIAKGDTKTYTVSY